MRRGRGSTLKPKVKARESMSGSPLVSIITVCRNAEATLPVAMESVLRQTYRRLQYIIIDGSSTDGTVKVIRSYEKTFKGRLIWSSGPDAGIYDAMNKGIKHATGSLIGILNADDWYEPRAIEHVVRSYRSHGEGVHYGILRVHHQGQIETLKAVTPDFLFQDVVGHPAYFVSKAIYGAHGVFDLQYRLAADYELMLRFHHSGVPFFLIEEVLANYQQGGASSIGGSDNLREYYRIRHRYGYLTDRQLRMRLAKLAFLDVLRRFRVRA